MQLTYSFSLLWNSFICCSYSIRVKESRSSLLKSAHKYTFSTKSIDDICKFIATASSSTFYGINTYKLYRDNDLTAVINLLVVSLHQTAVAEDYPDEERTLPLLKLFH